MGQRLIESSSREKTLSEWSSIIYSLAIAQVSIDLFSEYLRSQQSNRLCDYRRENPYG